MFHIAQRRPRIGVDHQPNPVRCGSPDFGNNPANPSDSNYARYR